MKKKSFFEEDEYMTLDPNMKVCANPVPKTIARAIAFLEKHELPPQIEKPKKSKKSTRSTLQNELLTIYNFEPTEQQMQQLKDFLAQLFADKLNTAKANQEVEMAA
jgi:hypothetical protein